MIVMINETGTDTALLNFMARAQRDKELDRIHYERQWKPGTLNKVWTSDAEAKVNQLGTRAAGQLLGISRGSIRRLRKRAALDPLSISIVKYRPSAGL
jgi:hypothetical protein